MTEQNCLSPPRAHDKMPLFARVQFGHHRWPLICLQGIEAGGELLQWARNERALKSGCCLRSIRKSPKLHA